MKTLRIVGRIARIVFFVLVVVICLALIGLKFYLDSRTVNAPGEFTADVYSRRQRRAAI